MKINNKMSSEEMLKNLKHNSAFKGIQYDIVFIHPVFGLVALSLAENDVNDNWMWWWTSEVDNRMYADISPQSCLDIVKNILIRHKDNVLVNTFPQKIKRS